MFTGYPYKIPFLAVVRRLQDHKIKILELQITTVCQTSAFINSDRFSTAMQTLCHMSVLCTDMNSITTFTFEANTFRNGVRHVSVWLGGVRGRNVHTKNDLTFVEPASVNCSFASIQSLDQRRPSSGVAIGVAAGVADGRCEQ